MVLEDGAYQYGVDPLSDALHTSVTAVTPYLNPLLAEPDYHRQFAPPILVPVVDRMKSAYESMLHTLPRGWTGKYAPYHGNVRPHATTGDVTQFERSLYDIVPNYEDYMGGTPTYRLRPKVKRSDLEFIRDVRSGRLQSVPIKKDRTYRQFLVRPMMPRNRKKFAMKTTTPRRQRNNIFIKKQRTSNIYSGSSNSRNFTGYQ